MLLQQMAQLAVQNHHDKSGFDTNFLMVLLNHEGF